VNRPDRIDDGRPAVGGNAPSPAHYSPANEQWLRTQVGRTLLTSREIGWKTLCVEERVYSSDLRIDDARLDHDQAIVVPLDTPSPEATQRSGVGAAAFATDARVGLARTFGQQSHGAFILLPLWFVDEAKAAFLVQNPGAEPRPLATVQHDEVIRGIANGLIGAVRFGAPDFYAQSAARMLAAQLVQLSFGRGALGSEDRAQSIIDKRIQRAIDYMEENLGGEIAIEDLAREACISPYHFVRVFRQQTGLTPIRLLTNLRMTRARTLLRETDLPVAEIGRRCGFRSQSAFSAAVLRHTGSTPLALRRQP